MSITWSKYQIDIFDAVANSNDSLLIEAVAGSGKTSTIVEAINYVPEGQSVCFVAFNKSIADELSRRVTRREAVCQTLHSVGWAAWRRSLQQGWESVDCKVNQSKNFEIVKEVIPEWKEREKLGPGVMRMVGLGKQHGIVPRNVFTGGELGNSYQGLMRDEEEVWEGLADHYGVDFEELGERGMQYVREVLGKCIERGKEEVDFDEMLYLPVVTGVEFDKWDVVFCDECQDLSGIQIEMIGRMVKI